MENLAKETPEELKCLRLVTNSQELLLTLVEIVNLQWKLIVFLIISLTWVFDGVCLKFSAEKTSSDVYRAGLYFKNSFLKLNLKVFTRDNVNIV